MTHLKILKDDRHGYSDSESYKDKSDYDGPNNYFGRGEITVTTGRREIR